MAMLAYNIGREYNEKKNYVVAGSDKRKWPT